MSDDALIRRVAGRLDRAERTQDRRELLSEEAAADALRLLVTVAPSPDREVRFGPLLLICWTYWFRAGAGEENPEAEAEAAIALALRATLRPRLPDPRMLPELPPEAGEPETDPHACLADFACLMSAACTTVAGYPGECDDPARAAALYDQGLAWLLDAFTVMPAAHEGYGDLSTALVALRMQRFEALAEPDSLTAAARTAAKACVLVPPSHPRQGAVLPRLFDVVVRAALLLGEPAPERVERLLAGYGITPLPDTAGALARLRELWRAAHQDPAEAHAATGLLLAAEYLGSGTAHVLACAAVRVRAALAALPPDAPDRGVLAATLHDILDRLGEDTGDAPRPEAGPKERIEAAVVRYFLIQRDQDRQRTGEAAALLDHVLDLAEQLARAQGLSGLPADVRAAVAFADCLVDQAPDDPSDRPFERLRRYRRAFDALAPDDALRPVLGVVLAGSALLRAEDPPDGPPGAAARWRATAAEVTEATAACAPEGFEPLVWLRAGHTREAVFGALCALTDPPWSADSERVLGRMGCEALREAGGLLTSAAAAIREEMGGDLAGLRSMLALLEEDDAEPPTLAARVGDIRTVLDRLGGDEDLRGATVEWLGTLLGTEDLSTADAGTLTDAAAILRQAYEETGSSDAVAARLAELLVVLGATTGEADLVMESVAVHEEREGFPPGGEPQSAGETFRALYFAVMADILAYTHAHDPDRMEHARDLLPRLIEAGRRADAEEPGTDENRSRAENLKNLIALVGPGGGPATGTTDEEVEACRRTFRAAPPGPNRTSAGMTLNRALLLRSMAVGPGDPDAAGRLIDEAETVLDAIADDCDAAVVRMVRTMAAHLRAGPGGPPVAGSDVLARRADGEDAGPATGPMGGLTSSLWSSLAPGDRLERHLAVLRSPGLSVWMRAHAGIAAAVNCTDVNREDIDRALALGAETVELLERVTDRGGPQHAAEHGLLGFDGDMRMLTGMIAIHLLHRRNATHAMEVAEGLRTVTERLERLERGDEAALAALTAALPDPGLIRTVRGPRVEAALALHERGRGLLLARRLESRTDLGALAREHPALSSRFARITGELERGPGDGTGRARLAARRVSGELDRLIAHIRTRPGFEDFLAPLPPERLRALAAEGPVVVLNHAGTLSCIAFVVTTEGATALLLDVRAQEVTAAAEEFARAIATIHARGGRRPPPSRLIEARDTIHRLLGWTWHTVVEPVLDQLRSDGALPPGTAPPRIWWVPTGPFGALPLHAAQCVSEDCERGRGSALDEVVSSYVPGFQTLAHARSRAARRPGTGTERALIVSETDEILPGAVAAARLTADAFAHPTLLVGDAATRPAVLAALERSQWVQFGCHAHGSPEEPSGGWIQLPSGEALSVADICRIRPESTRLAVLTACGTARTSTRLTDEAVHVSGAFLLAGYPQAVGTLWEVESTRIGAFLAAFHARSPVGGPTAAYAVHEAVRELRDRAPDRPHEWAAYLHAGA
ncbi:CHAT domain-containing protein [Streptomyces sp. NPDC059783]|uniref:CHAT domain-containing protein n=1 Tax=Streptomyces sp. NPDC059783 TaxID=3346944 RepID=UPI00364B248D